MELCSRIEAAEARLTSAEIDDTFFTLSLRTCQNQTILLSYHLALSACSFVKTYNSLLVVLLVPQIIPDVLLIVLGDRRSGAGKLTNLLLDHLGSFIPQNGTNTH
jgi:hypothetical protein